MWLFKKKPKPPEINGEELRYNGKVYIRIPSDYYTEKTVRIVRKKNALFYEVEYDGRTFECYMGDIEYAGLVNGEVHRVFRFIEV